jgi:hypothetical protein
MYTRSNKTADLTVPMVATIAAVFTMGILAPSASFAQTNKDADRQKDKNLMRNIAIGAAAGAVYSGVKKNTTAALVLGAGAAYAGKKYEDARKAQNRDNDGRFSYDYPRYDDGRYRNDDNRRDDYRYNDGGRRDQRDIRYNTARVKQNNGKHKGWYKNGKNGKDCD